ncbi:MAG: hypothetical protein ACKO7C_04125, partial [Bacteroidota bacterium]
MHRKILTFTLCSFLISFCLGQSEIVMLGHVGQRNAEIWVHWPVEGESVSLQYSNPNWNGGEISFTALKENHLNNKLLLSSLQPGTTYTFFFKSKSFQTKIYELTTQQIWQWRKDAPDFTIAFGSCVYVNDKEFDRPGAPYGQSDSIFNVISSMKPNAMIWGGDNIYLREGDFETQTNMVNRYLKAREVPSIKNLLSTCPQYAVWDDHDFGPNDSHS